MKEKQVKLPGPDHPISIQRNPTRAVWIAAHLVRIEDGILAEHWDVIQYEATKDQSKSGLPMFGSEFPGSV